jgi:predicted histone-like DNA-binding protein
MALKVKAKEQYQNIGKYAGKYRYVMMPELYTALTQDKVIKEAALRSGVSKGVMQACWDAAGEVIKAWATEGHSVALPGLGTMRFGLRAKSVASVNDVRASLITSRRIIFTPDVDLKDELKNTAVQITCYDRDGKEVKRVTSTDDGTVEDPEQENGSSNQGGNTGDNSGSQSENGDNGQSQQSSYNLTIARSGSGTSTVTDDSENVITDQRSFAPGSNLNIEIVPAEGQVPTATINGSSIELTENDGTYTGSFQMPAQGSVLELNSGSNGDDGDDGLDKD